MSVRQDTDGLFSFGEASRFGEEASRREQKPACAVPHIVLGTMPTPPHVLI
jgi:hypothetical protein